MDNTNNSWDFGTWQVDRRNKELTIGGNLKKSLGIREFDVLDFLIAHHGNLYSAQEILDHVWPPDVFVGPNSAQQAITKIQQKFRALGLAPEQIIEQQRGKGYRFLLVPMIQTKPIQQLPDALNQRIGGLLLRKDIECGLRRVLTTHEYPTLMMLSSEAVMNPVWQLIQSEERESMSMTFSPFGVLAPRIMHLDIFLLRANDKYGRPRLLNYYSGKPTSGWKAFMFLFRHRNPGETEPVRQRENAKDISEFLGLDMAHIHVSTLGQQFVISVKPDPGYAELAAYIFEFCSVKFDVAPDWLRSVDCELLLDKSARRFRWPHPEEMEQQERSVLVNGDVIRGVHHFYGTTLPAVPVGFPAVVG